MGGFFQTEILVILLVSLSLAEVSVQIVALIYARLSKVLKTRLSHERPLLRATVRLIWWVCAIQLILQLLITLAFIFRAPYTSRAIADNAPDYVVWVSFGLYFCLYASFLLPAIALILIMRAIINIERNRKAEGQRTNALDDFMFRGPGERR